ncbi:hypothetical protein DL98DRAFT_542957 [Cadophora sp. DSE1049]|nr:hypothetical protein DL98DRAFT_542957 [Cadophora sp. DSE1049]
MVSRKNRVRAALRIPGNRQFPSHRLFPNRAAQVATFVNRLARSVSWGIRTICNSGGEESPGWYHIQLERIVASIQDLVDPEDLGPLQHFKSLRWNRLTTYEVDISPLPKEEAAQTHNSDLHTSTDEFTIYTDASSMPRENSTGGHSQGRLQEHDPQLVYNGELERTTQAVEYASKVAKPGKSYYIYSDNQAGLCRLKTPSDNPGQACQIRAI